MLGGAATVGRPSGTHWVYDTPCEACDAGACLQIGDPCMEAPPAVGDACGPAWDAATNTGAIQCGQVEGFGTQVMYCDASGQWQEGPWMDSCEQGIAAGGACLAASVGSVVPEPEEPEYEGPEMSGGP